MDNNGVGFFDKSNVSGEKNIKLISDKRVLADRYQKENNKLVNQIWDIQLKLAETNLPNQQESQLNEQLEKLNEKVTSLALSSKIKGLKDEIQELEKESGISSSLSRGSPFLF